MLMTRLGIVWHNEKRSEQAKEHNTIRDSKKDATKEKSDNHNPCFAQDFIMEQQK